MSQHEASLHNNIPFERENYFQRYYICDLKMQNKNDNVKLSRDYPIYYFVPIPGLAQWTILQNKTLPVQSH